MRLRVFKIVEDLRSSPRKLLEKVDWLDSYDRQRIPEVRWRNVCEHKCFSTSKELFTMHSPTTLKLKRNDIFKWICPPSVWPLYAARAIAYSVANLVISPLDVSVLYLQAGILAVFHAKFS